MSNLNINEIKHELLSATGGSERYYHGMNKRVVYTEGVLKYYQLAECYWLHDLIQFNVYNTFFRSDEIISDTYYAKLEVENGTCTFTVKNYLDDIVFSSDITFTDHPEGIIDLRLGYDKHRESIIVCLPCED